MDTKQYVMHIAEGSTGGGGEPLVRLSQRGVHFVRPDGTIFKQRSATGFSAVHEVKEGREEKLRTYIRWLLSLGFNTIRVFCIWQNLNLRADRDAVRRTLEICKEEGIYVHLVCLCDQVDGSPVRMSRQEQLDWILFCIELAEQFGNVFIEEFNEFEKNDDDGVCGVTQPSAYGVNLGTRSWWGEDKHWNNAGSLLKWTTGHTSRGKEHARSCIQAFDVQRRGYGYPGGNAPATGLPHVHGEPARMLMDGHTIQQDADFQAGSLLFGAGACAHGDWKGSRESGSDLQNCEIPTGAVLQCAEAIGAVHKAHPGIWPMNTPDGNYVRGGVDNWNNDNKPDCPILHRDRYFGGPPEGQQGAPAGEYPDGCARSFFMEVGGKWHGIAIDPGPDWKLKPRDGWRLVAQAGYNGNMLVLERS
ncbi:MAG TPA: hypothetical protein VM531_11030 [Sphingomicrobium sp.]|jgi:hypothetical protein|nr:hypothetical protein [Sphingomicrobium sp.]